MDTITTGTATRFSRLLNGVFPRTPDSYRLLNDQCGLVDHAMEVFVAFMETADATRAKEVRRLEHEGDKLKARNIDALNRSFSTPFGREDIYRPIAAIPGHAFFEQPVLKHQLVNETRIPAVWGEQQTLLGIDPTQIASLQ